MTRRKVIRRNGRTTVARVRSPKHTGGRPSAWGGRSYPRLKWSHWFFGGKRIFRW